MGKKLDTKDVLKIMGLLTENKEERQVQDEMKEEVYRQCDDFMSDLDKLINEFLYGENEDTISTPPIPMSRIEKFKEHMVNQSDAVLQKSEKERTESTIYDLEDTELKIKLIPIDVQFINEEVTVFTYNSFDGEEDCVTAKVIGNDIFSEENGLTICVLKAIKKEVNKLLKKF